MGCFCYIISKDMEGKLVDSFKKKRKAVWRECIWCKARGIDPAYKSGKLKILQKHMVICQAAHSLEQQNLADTRPKIDLIMSMVQLQQKQIADLTGRLAVLEQRKVRKPLDPTNYWVRLTPKQCWELRKRNTLRRMRAVLSLYEPNPKLYKNHWEYFNWYFPIKPEISLILMGALWPCVEKREDVVCLRGFESTNLYCIFKNIWGKSYCKGTGFEWYIEALQELGTPPAYYDAVHISREANEFDRAIRKFQCTKVRIGNGTPQGLVPLVRIWRTNGELDEDVTGVCMSLPPHKELKWEKLAPPDPSREESVEAHVDSKSSSGHQLSTETPPDFVSVKFV